MPDSSPSVLIVRLDAVGDALALTPLIAALRAAGARVGIVLRPINAKLFALGTFDRVHVAHFELRSSTRGNLAAIAREADALAVAGYSHALIASEDPGGYRIARAARIPVRIGFENGWGKPFKTLWVRMLCTQTIRRTAGLDARAPHEAQVLFELGRTILGDAAEPTRDARVLRPLVLDDEPIPDRRVAFQITDKWERLGARFDDVVELVRRIAVRHDIRLIAPSRESAYADRIEDATATQVERFVELAPWKSAIAAARVLVAPDSGALHVAGMVGTPTVAAFAPIREFALQTARWSPWAAPYRIVKMEGAWPIVAEDAVEELLSGRRTIYTG
ncbi:MAG: glycosyltransferase family 9 protein [Vulcanimicrobiaceae bacterium]